MNTTSTQAQALATVSPSRHGGGATPLLLFCIVALLDAVTTHWILAHGGVELNPLSVPWVSLGWWGTYVHQLVVVFAVYGMATAIGKYQPWMRTVVYHSATLGKLYPLIQHNFQVIL